MNCDFKELEQPLPAELLDLKKEWRTTLTAPQDGMWESFRDMSIHWGISIDHELIGYACVNEEGVLIQFYLTSEFLPFGNEVFSKFIRTTQIEKGIAGTNNPMYLANAWDAVKNLSVHTYLFRDDHEGQSESERGAVVVCIEAEKGRIIQFYEDTLGAPREWLEGYVSALVERGELFYLAKDNSIVGTCEIRKSKTSDGIADLGMIVSPDHRKQGYGTYLLNQAKRIAKDWGLEPICSCEKENTGSFKAITNCGFVSIDQLLLLKFA